MIEVNNLHKSFGSLKVLKGITEKVEESEVVCVIGSSGSGKSTFLRCLNLLETPTSGDIWIDGKKVTDPKWTSTRSAKKLEWSSSTSISSPT